MFILDNVIVENDAGARMASSQIAGYEHNQPEYRADGQSCHSFRHQHRLSAAEIEGLISANALAALL
jgi:hypothetical protein